MKIIIGLGNPGEEYKNTRHNIGFEMLNYLKNSWGFPEFETNKKFNAEVSKKENLILAKPQTFMNLSGQAVRAILDFYKLTPDDIIVIHDDLDIAIGKYKIATESTSAGHNGVQNIIDQLGTKKFSRLRIGIGQTKENALVCRIDAHDFVLQKFSQEEKEMIEGLFGEMEEKIKEILN